MHFLSYPDDDDDDEDRPLSLPGWSFRVLAIEVAPSSSSGGSITMWEAARVLLVQIWHEEHVLGNGHLLKDTERVEIKLQGELAGRFESALRKEVEAIRVESGLNEFERKITSLIVFVGDDGKERRFLETVE